MEKDTMHKWVLLLLVFFISALFLSMIRQFLMAMFLAGIFSALTYPIYRRIRGWFKGRSNLAAVATLLMVVFVVLIPLTGLLGIVTGQAIKVGEAVKPWVQKQIATPDDLSHTLKALPFFDRVEPYRDQILTKAGEIAATVSSFLINRISSIAMGTVNFFFMLFVMLYAMFFFFMDGPALVDRILYYLPLEDHDERRLLDKFTSVSRATLKGTAIIGILQGGLSGIAFAVIGIPNAVFWGTVMSVLSVIPGIGTAIVWGPAAILLLATGHIVKGISLIVFCAVVVGSLDNVLRPALVGKDTQMHELMIFLGTMGGIFMFGMAGIFIGPVIAALFVTVWDIYGIAFADVLPPVGPSDRQE